MHLNAHLQINFVRNKAAGKRLLGFLPNVKVRTAFRDSTYVQTFRRELMRASMEFMIGQITDNASTPRNLALGQNGAQYVLY